MTATRTLEALRQSSGTYDQWLSALHDAVLGDGAAPDRSELDRVVTAAREWHASQVRADGVPYIVHPLRVATLVTSMTAGLSNVDQRVVVLAALLHDVLEDCDATVDDLSSLAGRAVAGLVCDLSAADSPGESKASRQRRKTAKWSRVERADRATRLVHCSDGLDNLISLRFLREWDAAYAKIPRWLMQAREYLLPIAQSTDMRFAQLIDEELAFELSRGFTLGRWSDD